MNKNQEAAAKRFDEGLYCAESVLATIAEALGIESALIPGIATGFCSGMARTCGPCGALTGGVLGLNLVFGRSSAAQSVGNNYAAVQALVEQFRETFGSTNCAELLGCDLGTQEGQRIFGAENLISRCREFTGKAAELTIRIIETNRQP